MKLTKIKYIVLTCIILLSSCQLAEETTQIKRKSKQLIGFMICEEQLDGNYGDALYAEIKDDQVRFPDLKGYGIYSPILPKYEGVDSTVYMEQLGGNLDVTSNVTFYSSDDEIDCYGIEYTADIYYSNEFDGTFYLYRIYETEDIEVYMDMNYLEVSNRFSEDYSSMINDDLQTETSIQLDLIAHTPLDSYSFKIYNKENEMIDSLTYDIGNLPEYMKLPESASYMIVESFVNDDERIISSREIYSSNDNEITLLVPTDTAIFTYRHMELVW